jgi:hypothetical protein
LRNFVLNLTMEKWHERHRRQRALGRVSALGSVSALKSVSTLRSVNALGSVSADKEINFETGQIFRY